MPKLFVDGRARLAGTVEFAIHAARAAQARGILMYALIAPFKAQIVAAVLSALAVAGTVTVATQQSSSDNGSQTVAGKAGAGNLDVESEGTDVAVGPKSGEVIGSTVSTLPPTQSGASASAGEGGVNGGAGGRVGSTGVGVGTPIKPGDVVPPVPKPGEVVGDLPGVPGMPEVPGVPDIGVPIPADPVGDGLAAFDHGRYTITIPGTAPITKQLCLSGAVDRCTTVSVGALEPVTFAVSYSSNISRTPPTFTPGLCSGGFTVTVAGLTPGATVTVSANGVQRSAVVPSRDVTQTASFCDG